MAGRKVKEEERDTPELSRVSVRLGSSRRLILMTSLGGFSHRRVCVSVTRSPSVNPSEFNILPLFFPRTIVLLFFFFLSYSRGKLFLLTRDFSGANSSTNLLQETPSHQSLPRYQLSLAGIWKVFAQRCRMRWRSGE